MQNIRKNNIKFFYQDNNNKILNKIKIKLKNDLWVNGKIINKFENNFKKKLNTNHFQCSCNSGTDALKLALLLDKTDERDIYITTPLSYIASSSVVKFLNLNLIYIDVENKNFLLDINKLEFFLKNVPKKIRKRLKGIIFVELFGHTTNLAKLKQIAKKNNLSLIGDCAQSFGTKFLGKNTCDYYDYAAYSFYPTKVLSAYGDAGMLAIKNKNNFNKAILIKNNGHSLYKKDFCKFLGINSRMDSIQALILNEKLKKINSVINKKKIIFNYYKKFLNNKIKKPIFYNHTEANNYIFNIYIKKKCRLKFLKFMKKHKIECKNYYQKLLPENKLLKPILGTCIKNSIYNKNSLISLPTSEKLSRSNILRISKLVNEFLTFSTF